MVWEHPSNLPRRLLTHVCTYAIIVKYFSPTTNLCIIRVAREHHRIAWGATTLLTKISGRYHIPHMVHLSGTRCYCDTFCIIKVPCWPYACWSLGTIKHAQLAAIKYDREVIARYRAHGSGKGVFCLSITCMNADLNILFFRSNPEQRFLRSIFKAEWEGNRGH